MCAHYSHIRNCDGNYPTGYSIKVLFYVGDRSGFLQPAYMYCVKKKDNTIFKLTNVFAS